MNRYGKPPLLVISIVAIIISGCNPDLIPLKGKYSSDPTEITSTRSMDSIWSDLSNLFAANGLRIKRFEKEKGIIISGKTSFIPVYTFEGEEGKLQKPGAWVVLPRIVVRKKEWSPKTIYGQWTIQVNEVERGTVIKVDPMVVCTYYPNMFASVEVQGQSTGKLEELIKSFTDK